MPANISNLYQVPPNLPVTFPTACLSIGKQADIVALESSTQQWLSQVVVDIFLACEMSPESIKGPEGVVVRETVDVVGVGWYHSLAVYHRYDTTVMLRKLTATGETIQI